MRRVFVTLVVLATLATLAVAPAAAQPDRFPDTIPLPNGFFPEGITIDGTTAYVGSLVDGSIVQQDLKAGTTSPFAGSPGAGKIAVGMDVDAHGRLWVAGGGPALDPNVGPGYRVYDTASGALLEDVAVVAGFVNDVIVTSDAAWFTDSFTDDLIRVPIAADGTIGSPEAVTMTGDWTPSAGFNANGIVATPDGSTLIVAQSTAPDVAGAALYAVPADPTASSVDAERIDINGVLAGADGLVLNGSTLFSVAGTAGVVKLQVSLSRARAVIVETIAVPDSVTPTTADIRGSKLYVVDAKFPLFGDPTTEFQTTAISR